MNDETTQNADGAEISRRSTRADEAFSTAYVSGSPSRCAPSPRRDGSGCGRVSSSSRPGRADHGAPCGQLTVSVPFMPAASWPGTEQ
jgi:hypothetical protein